MPKKSVNVDFAGYATKNDIKCKDGRTIRHGAFAHNDGMVVPLVWQHLHNDPGNVIGKGYLEHRDDGVYMYGTLNNTEKGRNAKELLAHGDIDHMSIYATNVVEKNGNVMHGDIKEVSLVISAANPGAVIEHVSIAHGDGSFTDLEDEVIIQHSGEVDSFDGGGMVIDIEGEGDTTISHADEDESDDGDDEAKTVEQIYNEMTDEQKNAVHILLGAVAADKNSTDSDEDEGDDVKHSDIQEGDDSMKYNPFENQPKNSEGKVLSHSDLKDLAQATFEDCRNNKISFRDSVIKHAAEYGIENIEILFPDARNVNNEPEFVKRRTEWVSKVLNGVKHSPFTRIKTRFADITADEARARGYLKGNKKIEEVFPVMQRVTTPQTIYKKQKLDRDDILDITDFDVVAWLKSEMRLMLEEELARCILISDGRLVTSTDKVKEENIRPIWTDDDFYSYKQQISAADYNIDSLSDAFIKARNNYEGSGSPEAFMSPETMTNFLLQRDNEGRRMYKTEGELQTALRVSGITEVPLFTDLVRTDSTSGKTYQLDAIIVNLSDYTVGTDRGGEITNIDDFNIDYNQYIYLTETRVSGALTGHHAAIIIEHEVTSSAARTAAAKNNG